MNKPGVRGRFRGWTVVLLTAVSVVTLAWTFWRLLPERTGATEGGRWVDLVEQPVEHRVIAKGVVVPMRSVDIVSPAVGVVSKVHAAWGDRVRQGDPLLQVDSQELDIALQEAEAALLRGQSELGAMRDKQQHPEYAGLVRRHQSARRSLSLAESRLQEMDQLYRQGIVARQEREQAELELINSQEQWQAAGDELKAADRKWSPESLRVVTIEQQIRRIRYEDLRERKKNTLIHAPISGILLQAPSDTDKGVGGVREIRVGTSVSARDVLMTIGDTSSYLVQATVGQEDLPWLQPGATAMVKLSSDGQAQLPARVHRVSNQPRNFNPSNASSMLQNNQGVEFDVQFLVQEPQPQPGGATDASHLRQVPLRLGAHVVVVLTAAQSAPAMAAPVSSVQWDAAGAPVLRLRAAGDQGQGTLLPVRIQKTTADLVYLEKVPLVHAQVWVPGAGEQASMLPVAGSGLPGRAAP